MKKHSGILNMTLDQSYEVKFNDKTNEYEYFHNKVLIPRKIDTLYKFLPFNENTIASLMQSYFWLANPAAFNDPFDCNKNLIVDYSKEDEENNFNKARNHFDNIGVISFTEKINNPVMWAHYTNNYNGLVLELDASKLHENTDFKRHKKYELRKVMYPEYNGPLQTAFEFANTIMLTSKFKSWEYEQEWRIIADIKDELRYLEFNPKIVKTIYLGYNLFNNNSSAVHIISILQKLHYPEAELRWMFPHPTQFGMLIARKF